MNKILKIKEPVKIRTKGLTNGCFSIYLDIYMNKIRRYEFLKLYIVPEYSRGDKEKNTETMRLANAIKAKRIIELQNNVYGFNPQKIKKNILLREYIESLSNKDLDKTAKKVILQALLMHLHRYNKEDIPLRQVDKNFILGFVDYLKSAYQEHCKKKKLIGVNTQAYYYKMFGYCLKNAVIDELIAFNPMDKIRNEEKPKRKRTEREFLTIEEVKLLAQTEFYNDLLKQAFLFSCFCGLRHSDIEALTWGNLKKDSSGGMELHVVQKKTGEAISLPLSKEAIKWLPKKKQKIDTDKVFKGLITLGRTNEVLSGWAEKAGIHKHVTFHVARHTHATMMITLGADIYTVSKLLGHTNIQTTQIYARIVDERKKKAIDLIPDIT